MKRYLILFSWALMAACSSDPEPADTVADNTESRPTLVQQVPNRSRLYTT